MSFYLLSKRHDFRLNLTQAVVFADVYLLDEVGEVVIAIGNRGEFICCNIAGKQLAKTILTNENDSNYHIFQVERFQHTLYILSQREIYLVNLKNILSACKNGKNIQLIQLGFENHKEQLSQLHNLTNKQIKIVNLQNQCFIKLCGRVKNQIFYKLLFVQDIEKGNGIVKYQFRQHFDYQFKTSLQSLSKDIMIYQASITKFKPITLFSLELSSYSSSSSQKMVTDELLIQHEVLQFNERMTIVKVQKINYSTICIIGNSHFQANYSSVVILYNLPQKYTMNNIDIKDTFIVNTYLFGNQHLKDYQYGDNAIFIDAIGLRKDKTNDITQIYPFCHLQTESTPICGTVMNSRSNYTLYKSNSNPLQIGIYSKIHKNVLYCMLLKHLLPTSNPKFYQQVIDFL